MHDHYCYATVVVSCTLVLQRREAPSLFAVFASPFTTLYKVLFVSAGEIQADDFINSSFHYVIASYALFIVFVVAMPVLFNNFLVNQ